MSPKLEPDTRRWMDELKNEFKKESEVQRAEDRKEFEVQRAEDRKEFEVQRAEDLKKYEEKLQDQGDQFRRTVQSQHGGTTPQAMAPDEIMKMPRMPSFNGYPCSSYPNGIRSFRKMYDARTFKMCDEDKVKYMIGFLTGQAGDYAASMLSMAREQRVPVVYDVFCKELRIFVEGADYLDSLLDDIMSRRQKMNEPLSHFAYEFQEGLKDLEGDLDTVPTKEHDRFRIFVRLVDPVVRERMKEHESEIRNIKDYVRKANAKGLGGFSRRVKAMDSARSTSASFTPRANGSSTPRANGSSTPRGTSHFSHGEDTVSYRAEPSGEDTVSYRAEPSAQHVEIDLNWEDGEYQAYDVAEEW